MQRAFFYIGMVGGATTFFLTLVVVGSVLVGNAIAAGAQPAASASGQDGHEGTVAPVEADPEAPAFVLRDPVAPELLAGETHEIELVMSERPMTVADGFEQLVWTFGDQVPGPVLRVKVGDVIRVTLKNPDTNLMPHSIDFHASMVAWNDEMRTDQSG